MNPPPPARRAGVVALALGLVLASCARTPPRGLVLVTIDTCRADGLGCYGGKVRTPALDGLAQRGLVFEDASAPVPLTLPSHCSMLTGLYPDRHGVRDNGGTRLPASAHTLAEILGEAGFRTAAFVAAFPLARRFGADQGFETYDDDFTSSAAGGDGRLDAAGRDVASLLFYDERSATEVVDAALPWLKEAIRGPRPFFAWIHFFDPHATYRPPARFAAIYGEQSYAGEIAYVDEQIARVLEELRGRRNVTVAVVGDHGESLGEHEEATHGLFVYESTIRVPWILSGAGVPEGRRVTTPVSLVDVLPTLLDLLGIAAPADLDGESTTPLIAGAGSAKPPILHGECLASELHYDWAPLRFARRGRWKLIEAPTPELYDLAKDAGETKNVAADHPDVVAELRGEIASHAARGGALAREEVALDPASRERLERLGYVGGGAPRAPRDVFRTSGKDPKDMVGFFNRLQQVPTLLVDGRYDDAQRELLELRRTDPGNRDVLQRLALLARTRGDWAAARDWCREALKLSPDDVETRMNLASALTRLRDLAAAKEEYRQVLARDPQHRDAWTFLGSLFSQEGAHGEAVAALERAVEIAPKDAAVRATYARALADAGRTEPAMTEYDRALALSPTLAAAVNGKALLLAHAGRAREAVQVLRGALPALEKDLDTLNNLAWILVDGSVDPVEGLEVARKARALAPDDPVVLDTFGWAAVRAGRASEGVEPLERAWHLTADMEVRAHLGVALAAVGRDDEGRAHVRAAVAARPDLAATAEIGRLAR